MSQFEEIDYNSKLDIGLWMKLFQFLKNCKKPAILLSVYNIIISGIQAGFPLLFKFAIDNFVTEGDFSSLGLFIGAFIIMLVLSGLLTYKVIELSGVVETTMIHDIRMSGFKKLQKLSFSYYDNTPVGWIMSRLTSDAQRIGDCVAWGCLDLIWAGALIMIITINMFILNAKMAMITFSIMPILIIVSIFFQQKILSSQRDVRKINSKITGLFNEGINGARTTKTLVRENKNFDEFNELSTGMKKASIRSALFSSIYLPVVTFLGTISIALVILSGAPELSVHLITLGTLSAFINYATQIFEPILQFARVTADMQSAQAAAERTLSLIDTEEEIKDSPEVVEKYGTAFNPKYENWEKVHGDIEFQNVSFSYKTGEPVLKDFSLKVEKGQRIALVGATGAGKSTIVNLLCRFYEPVSGQILIDGIDYRERSQLWLHANIGYVLQSPHLFSGTIKENIKYGKLDATDAEVIEAAKAVNAYDFIVKLENGFDTDVGEGGNRLSSGEKQLISFARAIIKKPQIFILDEATSSIDTETEQVIQQAIFRILEGRTSFIVAHRLSTIKSCDKILVIEDGRIAEAGSHKELIKQKGRYFKLYTNQFVEEQGQKLLNS